MAQFQNQGGLIMTDDEIMKALRDAQPSFMTDGLGLRGHQKQDSGLNISGPGFSGAGNDWSFTPPAPVPAEIQPRPQPLPPMELIEVTDCDPETGDETTRRYYVEPLDPE